MDLLEDFRACDDSTAYRECMEGMGNCYRLTAMAHGWNV